MSTAHSELDSMQTIITARVDAIRQAHANNLIESMEMGVGVLDAMLAHAREPVSNEEFTRKQKDLWLQRHQLNVVKAV